uniref:UBC core domain-containing protein n=1 Tax=Otus sunia TaxID=257818 RepID=A0A8C8AKA1_9STRI
FQILTLFNSCRIVLLELAHGRCLLACSLRITSPGQSRCLDFSCSVGVFAHIKFPIDYPYSPPTFRFLTKMWHPNIYENGDVCISILHPPVDDPQSGELPSERWNPTQNVRKQVLATKAEAEKDGVKVPTTLAEYCIKTKVPSNDNSSDLLYDDLYDDDIDDEDEEEEDADCYDDDDSGNEES